MTAANAGLVDATRAFLRQHAPFDRMADDALTFLVPRLALTYVAKDQEIVGPDDGPVKALCIVRRGRVGSRVDDPQAEADPTLGPGEGFPIAALSTGGASTKRYTALSDTFCLTLAREDFLELRRRSPEFERYCTQAITETLRQSLAQLQTQYSQIASDQQSLARPLSEVLRRAPVSAPAGAPLSEALARMNESNVRTLAVVNAEGFPIGILTLVDLLRRVLLPQRPLTTPVAEVMTAPVVTLPATATAAEAMQLLAERGIRQICVVDGRRLAGVINERDLFSLQRVSMRQVIEGMRAADSIDLLARTADDIRGLARSLLAQGVAAEPLTRTIVALNDALSRRAIELVLVGHDLADLDWCWLALGSEGRGEQTLATDQDNALVFACATPEAVEPGRAALLAFAGDVNRALARLGFPLCDGNVMAGNPELCLTRDEWKARFMAWLTAPTPEALLQANIVFDLRPLYGDTTLVDELREWLFAYTRENQVFLRLLAQNALEVTPPLGLIRAFATDDDPAHKGTLDLKTRGTRLFVDVARVFALAHGIADTGTATRLRIAARRINVPERHVEATVDAFHYLQLLRLRQQDLAPDAAHANRIDPDQLNEVDQRMLKEAFRQARKLQQRLRETWSL